MLQLERNIITVQLENLLHRIWCHKKMYKERVAEWLQIMLDLIIHLSMVEVANFIQGWIKPYNGTHKSLPLIKNKSRVIAFDLVIKYINIVKTSTFKCFKVIEFLRNSWTHFMLDIRINNSVDTSRTYLSVERPINEHEQFLTSRNI